MGLRVCMQDKLDRTTSAEAQPNQLVDVVPLQ